MFSMFRYDFMRYALLAVLLITPIFGLLGTMVVDNRMAFFSDSLGHSALTGVAIGSLLGLSQPLPAMLLFGMVYALLLVLVKNRGSASTDTTIGVFSAAAISLGVVLASKGGGFAKYSNVLIGDLLSVRPSDLIGLAVVFVGVVVLWLIFYNRIYQVSLNPALAASRGVRALAMEILFAMIIAVVVMSTISWVGILIINALLVLPAATARCIARSVRGYTVTSVVLAVACGVVGLLLSYGLETAAGATIVLLLTICYFVSLMLHRSEN